jgi:Ala-tRNA(Pro) deacylase
MIAPMNEMDLLSRLNENNIKYDYYAHPAVMTSAEAALYMGDAPGVSGKNLFMREKKGGRFFLLMTFGEKRVDLKQWGKQEDLGRLSFSESQALADYLEVGSGAVGPLALITDVQNQIEVFVDCALWDLGLVRCHPLVNTASLVLTVAEMEKFFLLTNHSFKLVNVPFEK